MTIKIRTHSDRHECIECATVFKPKGSITVGVSVQKVSGKPFQSGQKVAVVQDIKPMTVPSKDGLKTVNGLVLEGCVGLVEAWRCMIYEN